MTKPFALRLKGVAALCLVGGMALPQAQAHEFKVGDVVIVHPYATPTPSGSPNGALYLRTLKNEGRQPDRLLGARTPRAAAVEIHSMELDAQQVMHMRQLPALELPAGAKLSLRHGDPLHLMLMNLKTPLQAGEHFPVTLRFERAGEREVNVWVQRVSGATNAAEHAH